MSVYISEFNVYSANAGGDFVEVVAPIGTDLSGYSFYEYDVNGNINSGPFSFGEPVNTEHGVDIYVLDNATPDFGLSIHSGLVVVDDTGGVVQFLSKQNVSITANEGPALGLTSTQTGGWPQGFVIQSNDGGATYFKQPNANKGSIPCFASGTQIATLDGNILVDEIEVGQAVRTANGATATVIWTQAQTIRLSADRPDATPILIEAGALGPGRPAERLIVSANHRILVGKHGQLMDVFPDPVFVPAKALINCPGIRKMRGRKSIRWVHFAFDRHDVVLANGCVTESLLLGPMVLSGLRRSVSRTLEKGRARGSDGLNGPMGYSAFSVQKCHRKIRNGRRNPPAQNPRKQEESAILSHM